MMDYLAEFPVPAALLPERLRSLLEPVGIDPALRVEVSSFTERDPYGPNSETVQMLMAVVPDDGDDAPPVLHREHGMVAHSTPVLREKGSGRDFSPSVDGHDYIVASWGSGSFHTYHLAEKVWMALGLTPRCFGNEQQRLVYDDLELPEFGVAEGEISGQYYYEASRNIRWFMSNEYLRKYLWLRGGRGVRQFYYQAMLPGRQELRDWMNGQAFVEIGEAGHWVQGDIREDEGGFLLQVWVTVVAVTCELCLGQTAEGLVWPDIGEPVTRARANALIDPTSIFLDDRFLERYEENRFYDTTPVNVHGIWHCSPSYLGQWAFTDCKRIGRNLIKVRLRELYQGIPDREILHARAYALDAAAVAQFDLDEEHFVAKVNRLLTQLLDLGENLSRFAAELGIEKSAEDLIGFVRAEVHANGWLRYPQLAKLAQVAPLAMSQQAFLARCKSIHEIWQRLPNGFLKQILQAGGVPRASIANRGSLKLLESLLNLLQRLDADDEAPDAFRSDREPEGWDARNDRVGMLFVANDLRIADAHDAVGESLQRLQDQGFDIASLHEGHGRALDFVMDGVIDAFAAINGPLSAILRRA
ncbi:hypothetical protein [Burkholderia sp. F1]|uniref:hypothetical protein n=1 Tax=Burkholderia sp. F1 TaxID=3366817 RepID=UPI003D7061B5